MSETSASLADIQPRKAPVQARSRARFETILETALALIMEQGSDTMSMREIATRAGISIASLYQYFPDKAAIIATLAERCFEEGRDYTEAVFAPVRDPVAFEHAVQTLAEGHFARLRDDPASLAIWRASQSDPRLQAQDDADEQAHTRIVSDALGRAAPHTAPEKRQLYARLMVSVLSNCLRTSVQHAPEEGRVALELCQRYVLTPSLNAFFNQNEVA